MGAALRVARRGPSADVRAEAGSSSPSPEHKSEAWLAADRRRVLEEGRCAAPADAFDVLLTAEEVARHDRLDDAWVIVEGRVFDVTDFIRTHPGWKGGSKVSTALAIQRALGTDCTEDVLSVHPRRATLQMEDYCIGPVGGLRQRPRFVDRGARGPEAWELRDGLGPRAIASA